MMALARLDPRKRMREEINCCSKIPTRWKGVLLMQNVKKENCRISDVICCSTPPVQMPTTIHVDRLMKLTHTEEQVCLGLPYFELVKPKFTYHPDSEWCKFLSYMYKYKKVAIVTLEHGWQLLLQPPTHKPPNGFKSIHAHYRRIIAAVPPKWDPQEVLELPDGIDTPSSQKGGTIDDGGLPKPSFDPTAKLSRQPKPKRLRVEGSFSGLCNKGTNTTPDCTINTTLQGKNSPKIETLKSLNNKPMVHGPFKKILSKSPHHSNSNYSTQGATKVSEHKCFQADDVSKTLSNGITDALSQVEVSNSISSECDNPSKQNHLMANTEFEAFDKKEAARGNKFDAQKISEKMAATRWHWEIENTMKFMYLADDRNATRVHVDVEELHWPTKKQNVVAVSITDNGKGMSRREVMELFQSQELSVPADFLVLSLTEKEEYVGLISRGFTTFQNDFILENISYCQDDDPSSPLDIHEQREEVTVALDVIEKYSPFNMLRIRRKFKEIKKMGATGTCMIFCGHEGKNIMWEKITDGSGMRRMDQTEREGENTDIEKVLLARSLHLYTKIMYFEPKIMLYIQKIKINESLGDSRSRVGKQYYTRICEKQIQLWLSFDESQSTLGRGGICLYNKNRLVKAYIKVGKMIEDLDYGQGVVGAVDITSLMDVGNEMLNFPKTMKEFKDTMQYKLLMKWLTEKVHEYYDKLNIFKNGRMEEPDKVTNAPKVAREVDFNQKLPKGVGKVETDCDLALRLHSQMLKGVIDGKSSDPALGTNPKLPKAVAYGKSINLPARNRPQIPNVTGNKKSGDNPQTPKVVGNGKTENVTASSQKKVPKCLVHAIIAPRLKHVLHFRTRTTNLKKSTPMLTKKNYKSSLQNGVNKEYVRSRPHIRAHTAMARVLRPVFPPVYLPRDLCVGENNSSLVIRCTNCREPQKFSFGTKINGLSTKRNCNIFPYTGVCNFKVEKSSKL